MAGGANVGMLFYNPSNPLERYNMPDTLKCQHTFKLTRGNCLYSDMGRIFCSIVEDSVGWHDTVGGNSTRASVAARWGHRSYQEARNERTQNGHDSFLVEAGKYGLGRRDLAANVNWFSKVSVADDGAMTFHPNHSKPGDAVALRFEMDTLVLLHTCAHPLDTSPTYPRRPVALSALPGRAGRARRLLPQLPAGELARLREQSPLPSRAAAAGSGAGAAAPVGGRAAARCADAREPQSPPTTRSTGRSSPPASTGCTRCARGRRCASSTSRATRRRTRSSTPPTIRSTATAPSTRCASSATSTSASARRCVASSGRILLEIVADTVGRHDTLGGACATESNTVRYALEKKTMHACRDSWLLAVGEHPEVGLTKRDIAHNINFFMNVPVTEDGGLNFADGVSGPGKYVEMRAAMDVWVLISNCPQLNNPCNAYNPTPIEVLIFDAESMLTRHEITPQASDARLRLRSNHVLDRPRRQSRRHRLPHHSDAQAPGRALRGRVLGGGRAMRGT